jgi:hypothetical protein
MLKAAREEEAFLRELEERKKQRDEQRRLREEEIRNSEEVENHKSYDCLVGETYINENIYRIIKEYLTSIEDYVK